MNLLKYENVRSINKDDFDKYRVLLIERVKSEWKKLSFHPVEDDSFDNFLGTPFFSISSTIIMFPSSI